SVNATPVADETMLYVGAGSPFGASPLWAIKAGASGDISLKPGETSNAGIAWSSTRGGPPMASPLLYQDHLYILMQNGGMLNCYEAKTGQEIYKQRLKGAKSFTSSPWLQDGKLYFQDQSRKDFDVTAGQQFYVVGKK